MMPLFGKILKYQHDAERVVNAMDLGYCNSLLHNITAGKGTKDKEHGRQTHTTEKL